MCLPNTGSDTPWRTNIYMHIVETSPVYLLLHFSDANYSGALEECRLRNSSPSTRPAVQATASTTSMFAFNASDTMSWLSNSGFGWLLLQPHARHVESNCCASTTWSDSCATISLQNIAANGCSLRTLEPAAGTTARESSRRTSPCSTGTAASCTGSGNGAGPRDRSKSHKRGHR